MKAPLVSVLMTAYNREQYIAEAIESVLVSDFEDWELIIVDDGSKDNTVAIARQYAATENRIQVYINEQNLGDYANRNRAATYARGKYIKYLDSDDCFLPGGFFVCVDTMENNPAADWGIYCADKFIKNITMTADQSIRYHFFKSPFLIIGPSGTIIKRAFFEKIGGFPEKYGPANDMYFNLRAASRGTLVTIGELFVYYRVHEGQEINNKFSYLINTHNYYKDALAELDLPLSYGELKWLRKKSNRKFAVRLLQFLMRDRDLRKTLFVLKETRFGLKETIDGLFIKQKP